MAGSVVNSATNEPVRGAIVYINGRESRTAMAGSDGHFEIEGVPGGSAFVTAQRPGFSPPIQQAQITIGPSSDSLVVKLVPFSKISGRITDREGEPIEGINVQCMTEVIVNGRKQWQQSFGANTDETGHFLIENMTAGTYILSTRETRLYVAVQPKSEAARYIYPQTFYPDAPTRELAQAIELAPGEEMRADMVLQSMRGFQVSFATEPRYPNVFATISDGDSQFAAAQADATGLLTFSGVPPGSWKIEVRGGFSGPPNQSQEPLYGELPIEVGNTDIENLKIPLGKMPTIPIQIEDGVKSGIFLQLFSKNGPANGSGVDQNGAFEIPSVAPGSYRVLVQPRETCIASLMSGSVNLLKEELVVTAGSSVPPIQVTKGDHCASLTVAARSKTPGTVVVLSDSKAFEPQIFGTSEQGYTLNGLQEGEYQVYAFDDISNLEYANPDALRNFKSQTVSLEAGQKLSVEVDVEERHPK